MYKTKVKLLALLLALFMIFGSTSSTIAISTSSKENSLEEIALDLDNRAEENIKKKMNFRRPIITMMENLK